MCVAVITYPDWDLYHVHDNNPCSTLEWLNTSNSLTWCAHMPCHMMRLMMRVSERICRYDRSISYVVKACCSQIEVWQTRQHNWAECGWHVKHLFCARVSVQGMHMLPPRGTFHFDLYCTAHKRWYLIILILQACMCVCVWMNSKKSNGRLERLSHDHATFFIFRCVMFSEHIILPFIHLQCTTLVCTGYCCWAGHSNAVAAGERSDVVGGG